MQSGLFAQAVKRSLSQQLDDTQIVISEHPNLTVEQCRLFQPYALLMEVSGYAPWQMAQRMALRDRVKRQFPNCKVVLIVDEIADDNLAQAVKEAKRKGDIDAFLYSSTSETYLAAMMDSL